MAKAPVPVSRVRSLRATRLTDGPGGVKRSRATRRGRGKRFPRSPREAQDYGKRRRTGRRGPSSVLLESGRRDLNPRPQRPERCALPSCATSRGASSVAIRRPVGQVSRSRRRGLGRGAARAAWPRAGTRTGTARTCWSRGRARCAAPPDPSAIRPLHQPARHRAVRDQRADQRQAAPGRRACARPP